VASGIAQQALRTHRYNFGVSFAKQLLATDIRYSAWSNRRVLDACSALTAEEIERDMRISHANILRTLRHICDAERVWLDCLRTTVDGGSWVLPQGEPPRPSFDDLLREWPVWWKGYEDWIEGISEDGLEGEITVRLPGAVDPSVARWKILRHVLEHSTLHRGQIIGMIRMLGRTPPGIHRMDYYLAAEPGRI
jgi:uncharacterized damage-inducible protein DinB